MSLLTATDHKVLSEAWATGFRIYGSPKRQLIVEKDGQVKKIYNLKPTDDPDEKLMAAYHYYHGRGFVI